MLPYEPDDVPVARLTICVCDVQSDDGGLQAMCYLAVKDDHN